MKNLNHLWYILAAYGVWFAILSGMEEMVNGKFWKAPLALILGIVIYLIIEGKSKK